MSVVRTDIAAQSSQVEPHTAPAGYGPADLQDAYDLPSAEAGTGQTVAIIDAFDNPNAEADLAVYRAQYGLPECSTANGCFRKVSQRGDENYPLPDQEWAGEIALDLDMVSAICPNCHILLVEADDNGLDNLGAAVNEAVALGATYVSNSYGAIEDSSETTFDQYYNHPGVAITASSGDDGFGVSYPAASPYVTAVGGTSLRADSSARGWTETVWSGAGSGCSRFEPKPAWQTDAGCGGRTVADVSAVSDPATGVAVYNTYQDSGWRVYGGTSAAAPLIASAYALAGTPAPGTVPAQYLYEGASDLNDVTSGTNGGCSPAYLCNGTPGYDGPTGLGTPHGIAAFASQPRGVVSGTVTDSSTGELIAGARITAGTGTAATDADGRYVMGLRAGTYDITATAYGYQPSTVSGVVVNVGDSVIENFFLDRSPTVALHGTVRDGSGHGWPLYARVSVANSPEATYTDPKTGRYQLNLPGGIDYSVVVDPVYPGYQRAETIVRLTEETIKDIAVPVELTSCAAPGYGFAYDAEHQGFDGSSAPAGWTVDNDSPHGFEFDNPGNMPNNTGGTGNFALADPYHYQQWQHTTLTSPAFDLAAVDAPIIEWKEQLAYAPGILATIEVSVDGGGWQTVHTAPEVPIISFEMGTGAVALPQAAGHRQVRIRFRLIADAPTYWWEVDDVFVGNRTCVPMPGALLSGEVTSTSGTAINRAVVSNVSDPRERTTSVFTTDDPALGDGFYYLFAGSTGRQQFQATQVGYRTARATVQLTTDALSWQNFVLRPAKSNKARTRT